MDCGDSNCEFTASKGGMRTNGGCRCIDWSRIDPDERVKLRAFVRESRALRADRDAWKAKAKARPDITRDDALAKYTAEYAGITEDDLAWMADAPPSDGGARQMDEAIARREARIAELEARVEAAESKLALVRDLALSGERSSWRRDVLAILGGE